MKTCWARRTRKFRPGDHPGIVLFRPESLGPLYVNRFIINFVDSFAGAIVVVEPHRIREFQGALRI